MRLEIQRLDNYLKIPRFTAVERKRLLHRQTAFVVAGRQVFLPFFGIALRDDFGV